jgi:hypothetical protein
MAEPLVDPAILAALRASLPDVARRTVAAVLDEVPNYASSLSPAMGANIEGAVQSALDAFLRRVGRSDRDGHPGSPAPGLDAAYALGVGEARTGRTIDPLLAAYRVGARASWVEMSTTLVDHGVPAATVADLAGRVFAYIDELSAASVAGHADQLAQAGRVREQYLEELGRALLSGEDPDRLVARADRAGWMPPDTLTAVVLPSARSRGALARLDPRTLVVAGDDAGPADEGAAVLLVPDAHRDRRPLTDALRGRVATVGPSRPWTDAATSHRRAVRTAALVPRRDPDPVDADDHLVALVVGADPGALDDLRARALAPLAGLRPATRARLEETLRSWLVHNGRRSAVAADLHVHPQTVRYRMGQLRERFGERLDEPEVVLALVVALAHEVPDDEPAVGAS